MHSSKNDDDDLTTIVVLIPASLSPEKPKAYDGVSEYFERNCAECGEKSWSTTKYEAMIAANRNVRAVCVRCVTKNINQFEDKTIRLI